MRTFEGAIAAPDFQLIAPSLGHHFSFQSGQHLISFLCDIVSFSSPPPPPPPPPPACEQASLLHVWLLVFMKPFG